jgi:hypothetical protein
MTTSEEGIVAIKDEKGNLAGIIYKDPISRKNVFYAVSEMSFDDLQALFKREPNIK